MAFFTATEVVKFIEVEYQLSAPKTMTLVCGNVMRLNIDQVKITEKILRKNKIQY